MRLSPCRDTEKSLTTTASGAYRGREVVPGGDSGGNHTNRAAGRAADPGRRAAGDGASAAGEQPMSVMRRFESSAGPPKDGNSTELRLLTGTLVVEARFGSSDGRSDLHRARQHRRTRHRQHCHHLADRRPSPAHPSDTAPARTRYWFDHVRLARTRSQRDTNSWLGACHCGGIRPSHLPSTRSPYYGCSSLFIATPIMAVRSNRPARPPVESKVIFPLYYVN